MDKPHSQSELPIGPIRPIGHSALLAAGLFALAFAVFANSLGHDFVWDDVPIIRENPFLASPGAWWQCFGRDFGLEIIRQPAGYYRPLVFLSFIFNHALGGVAPFGYHLFNVALHGINVVLVFLLLTRLGGWRMAAPGAAVFAVHPVHTESVAFVSGRSDLLCGCFLLLTLLATVHSFEAKRGRHVAWSAASLPAYIAALLSKELAVVLPGVLLAHGLIQRYRLRNLIRLCAPTALLALAYLGFRHLYFPMGGYGHPFGAPQGNVVARGARLVFLYAAQQAFPVIPTVGADVLTRHPWVDAVAVVLLALLLAAAKPRRRAAGAAVWLALFLAPTLWVNLFKGIELSDRFAYVPSIGVCALAAMVATRYWDRLPISRFAVLLVAVAFALLSIAYSGMWRGSVSLWTASATYHPRCGRSYYNLGNALWQAGDRTGAVRALYQATRSLPDEERRCWAYSKLADVLAESGEEGMAIEACRAAIRLRPDRAPIRRLLASLLSDQGKHDEAIVELGVAERILPDDPAIQMDLAREYLATKPPQPERAQQCYRRARQLGAASDEAIEKSLNAER
jgi:tetratricopeptide (TPR) repeat protein